MHHFFLPIQLLTFHTEPVLQTKYWPRRRVNVGGATRGVEKGMMPPNYCLYLGGSGTNRGTPAHLYPRPANPAGLLQFLPFHPTQAYHQEGHHHLHDVPFLGK